MSLDVAFDVAASICLIAGALLSLAAGIALVRFPDLLTRMHAAAKPQVLGLLLVLVGCALRLRTGVDITTLVLVGAFSLATAPVAAHMVGRAAYPHEDIRTDLLVTDELAAHLDRVAEEREHSAPA
ncbi:MULTISPECIES: monovalent cation/H(+) antiporter subunit G [unclassified Micromonospora]|uniref:monovalent cation/H(+) antiporter subunit G n=1 Tax=unclassified Micromonospora TaxID=2617518 RepID=UPI0022B5E57B|nr:MULTISPECIES: monovalent cation/H(+) antiporter subunit G [unclassified Micromonospora]MCZ7423207.1 monovalent cation/H(+) antiporter subunit G [Verrucosispora sp. WMMA2121]WBB90896.1 monovalent cation/H(+) antiporter subunit G [Verrucosispora sp. WMMC514]